MNKYKVVLTDDEALFRKGLSKILSGFDGYEVSFEAKNGLDLLNRLKSCPECPDLILLDIQMPELNGIETIKLLYKNYPTIKVIVLTSHYHPTFIREMIELGASGFMPKNINPDELLMTLKNVLEKGFHYNDYTVKLLRERILSKKNPSRALQAPLTKREMEILKLICQQYTNKEISKKLFLSPRTVEGYRKNLLEKTASKNSAGLIIFAIENRFFNIDFK